MVFHPYTTRNRKGHREAGKHPVCLPKDYIIDYDYNGNKYPVSKQVARIGNSVVPTMARKLVECNCGYLKVGERMPNTRIDDSGRQLRFA